MSRPAMRFTAGDEVVWKDINQRGVQRFRVLSVGRKLVRIDGDERPYRKADGTRNDGYGHASIRPLDVFEWDESIGEASIYLRKIGFIVDYSAPPERIVWAAKALRAACDSMPEPLP